MTVPLQKHNPYKLSDEQLEALQSEDHLLRGSFALDILNTSIPDSCKIPADFVFRKHEKDIATRAINATFGLIGGVPKFVMWADQNLGDFYKMFAKQIGTENVAAAATNIQIVAPLPTPAHAAKFMDERGFVHELDEQGQVKVQVTAPKAKRSLLEDEDDDE